MKRLLSICLVLLSAFGCLTPVYATETTSTEQLTLPELPDLAFDEPYPSYYNVYKIVFKVGSDYYASVFEESTGRAGQSMCIIRYVDSSGLRISFGSYGERYVETYKLSSSGTEWVLVYETGSAKASGDSITEVYLSDYLSHTEDEWLDGWNLRELVVYSDYADDLYISRSQYTASSNCYLVSEDDYYDITFEDTGGSTSGGGFTGGWGEEDKGWLGGLFDDLFTFLTSFYNNLKTKLESIATTITESLGNFISSAVSNISTFISNAVTSISGFFANLISTIETVRLQIEEFFTSMFDALYLFWENLMQGIKDWFAELWKPVEEWLAEQKELSEQRKKVWESFTESIELLLDSIVEVTIKPVMDFFDSLSEGAIAIWLSFFSLPFIRELSFGVILVALFAGILTLLLTF